jgi:hypothetical protein
MKRRKRKSDHRETAQFAWTLIVGLAAAVAALHEASTIREPASITKRAPAVEKQHGYSPVELLDTRPANK